MIKKTLLILTVASLALVMRADFKAQGSDSTLKVVKALAAGYTAETGKNITLQGGGSGAGSKAVIAGSVTLAFLSRDLDTAEVQGGLIGYAYAKDGVAVIVNPSNPVVGLTRAELKDIYTGKSKAWSDGKPLIAFNRNADSGTREVFQGKVMGKEAFSPSVAIKHDGVIISSVEKIPAAIAYTSLGEADATKVKIVPVDGIAPSAATLKDGTYPIARTPTLATKGEASGEEKAFIDFVLGPKGQAIVSQQGLSPLK